MTTRSGKNLHLVHSTSSSPSTLATSNMIQQQLNEFKESFTVILRQTEDRIMQRIGDLQAEISNLKSSFQVLASKQNATVKKCDSLELEVECLKQKLDKFEMNAASSDVLVLNVPTNIDAAETFAKITSLINCSSIKVRKVFRTKQDNALKNVPIIAKLDSPSDRSLLLRSLSEFRKLNKRPLKLRDLDYDSDDNVSIFECLSPLNKEILQSAMHLKRNGLLVSTFTVRGIVYAKKSADGGAVKVRSIVELNRVVGSAR